MTGWDGSAARLAAHDAFLDWHDRRHGDKREAADGFVEPLQAFVSADLCSLVPVKGPHVPGADPAGWCDGNRALLTPRTWTTIFPGVDGTKAAKALIDMHLLQPGDGDRVMRKAPASIPGRPRLYTVLTDKVVAYKAV